MTRQAEYQPRKEIIMIRSLFSGVSGLKTHQQKMDVIGNNIANVNTTGYKTSVTTFQEVYYQTKKSGAAGSAIEGGVNPSQVGYGTKLGAIGQVMGQSGFTYSDSVYDCALSGDGFFQVMDEAGNIFYTRAGVFNVDNAGNLVDSNGNMVLGVSGDATGVEASSNRITFSVPEVLDNEASYSKDISYKGGTYPLTVSAATATPDGNISIGFVTADSDYAYLSGTKLIIQLNANNNYTSAADVEDAIKRACQNGGVDIDGVLPLSFEMEVNPPASEIPASTATNTMMLSNAAGTSTAALTFTSTVPGEYANSYAITVRYSKGAAATSAKWNNNGLTVTVCDGATLADIQAAIDAAAGGNDKYKLTVTSADWDANVSSAPADFLETAGKVGLAGGSNNFFSDMVDLLGNIKLTDGRVQAEQTVKDLDSVYINEDGTVYGVHAVHGILMLGRIDIVTFDNPNGLEQVGNSYWRETLASGEPSVTIPGENGSANVVSGALEMSNVDLSQEFSDMIITQRGFQANSRIITTSDTMLEEIVNLKR